MLESLKSLDYLEEANLRAFRSELNSTHYLTHTLPATLPVAVHSPTECAFFFFFLFSFLFFFPKKKKIINGTQPKLIKFGGHCHCQCSRLDPWEISVVSLNKSHLLRACLPED